MVGARRESVDSGPSSSRWSFALGDPDTSTISDNRWEYVFQTGNEVADFGHTRVREGMITNASAGTNYGSASQAMLGTHRMRGVNVVDACRMIIGLTSASAAVRRCGLTPPTSASTCLRTVGTEPVVRVR